MKNLSKWFTLIELLITMTIIMLISTISFSNYIYRSQLDSIRYWSKQITQLLTLARNQSIYWYYWTTDWNTTNKNIAIYFEKDKNTVSYYSIDLKYKWITPENISSKTFLWENENNSITKELLINDNNKIQEILLWNEVKITKIFTWENKENQNNLLILFPSIKWDSSFYIYDSNLDKFIKKDISNIFLELKYKNSTNPDLTKNIEYNNITNLINYK